MHPLNLNSGKRAGRGPSLAVHFAILAAFLPLLASCELVMIHDISTDLENPPVFEAVLPLRAGASNPPEYGGAAVAEKQRQSYPDIAPLFVTEPMERVFAAALQAAGAMGWEIVTEDPAQGRLEAVATTAIMRFKDDVVVRLRKEGDAVRVDVRSKSRIGRSDLGANARRIRSYLKLLRVSGLSLRL